jgi:hypothetical protein
MPTKSSTNIDNVQTQFITTLKKSIPHLMSPVDGVANVLDISYDAAYRRISGRVPFSLSEAVKLAEYYKLSLNDYILSREFKSYVVRESQPIHNMDDFATYLRNVNSEIQHLVGREEAHILFASRELPMFYFFSDPLLVKLKIYLWNFLNNIHSPQERVPFSDFVIPDKMLKDALKLGKNYRKVNMTEIWSYGAVNNVIQQMIYLFKMRQFTPHDIHTMANALRNELKKLEKETLLNKQTNRDYKMYFNEIVMNNNAIIITYKGVKKFYYPYTLLKFFVIDDQSACKEQENYLLSQLQYCVEVTNTNLEAHAHFFNSKYDKIDYMLNIIDSSDKNRSMHI